MRRAPLIVLTVAALTLSGCSGDRSPEAPPAPTGDAAPEDPAPTDGATGAGDDAGGSTAGPDGTDPGTDPGTDGDATTGGADTSRATVDPEEVEGGEDGQAAADVAQAFVAAMVRADPAACDHMVSFSDVQRPMSEVEEDQELCAELLPVVLAEEVDAQGLDEEGATMLAGMEITGAEVDGDTAVVDRDNVSPLFADSLGEETITLTRIEGRWYVDLDRSFVPPDPR
ncbi:hypothetical protein ACQE98_06495 [Ornithinimicrobium sp. W1679]|uniref:hypothetical protein n=1 Tax=Ornithinimicrobium sp. W1679 TaxID=3418770 RepID=UPI003CEADA56